MFNWFRKWRHRRKRQLFRYWDGSRQRRIDPWTPLFLMARDPEYRDDLHPGLVEIGDPDAIDVTVNMVQVMFNVKEYDPETDRGLTKIELMNLLIDFLTFNENVKKNTDPSPTSPESTDATLSKSNGTIPNDSTPSTSCETELTPARPIKSGPESP